MSGWKDRILERVVNDFKKDPSNFLRADRRRNNQQLATKYWKEMQSSTFFPTEIQPKLPKETAGNPFNFNQYNLISPLSVQHLYHLFTMKMKSEVEPYKQCDLIVEFGGGFGNLCRLMYCLGFTGEYVLVDFPEQLEIQKHFLTESGVDLSNISFMTLDSVSQIKEKIESKKSTLIGTYSISEMPISDRKIIEELYNHFNYIFIIYKGKDFDGVDNSEYFNMLSCDVINTFEIQDFEDIHYGKSRFLIGKRGI